MLAPLLGNCVVNPADPYTANAARTSVSVLSTPLLVAVKIPTCIVTFALGVPVVTAAELGDPYQHHPWSARAEVDHAVAANCGPPWILPP
jgi:hypothetical protein